MKSVDAYFYNSEEGQVLHQILAIEGSFHKGSGIVLYKLPREYNSTIVLRVHETLVQQILVELICFIRNLNRDGVVTGVPVGV